VFAAAARRALAETLGAPTGAAFFTTAYSIASGAGVSWGFADDVNAGDGAGGLGLTALTAYVQGGLGNAAAAAASPSCSPLLREGGGSDSAPGRALQGGKQLRRELRGAQGEGAKGGSAAAGGGSSPTKAGQGRSRQHVGAEAKGQASTTRSMPLEEAQG
jgi:hypothetical protein